MNKKGVTICGFEQKKNGFDSIGNEAMQNCKINGLTAVNVPFKTYIFFKNNIDKIDAKGLNSYLNKRGLYPY